MYLRVNCQFFCLYPKWSQMELGQEQEKNLKLSFFDINHPMFGISNFLMCCFKSITFIHVLDEHAIFELSNLLEFAFFKLVHQPQSIFRPDGFSAVRGQFLVTSGPLNMFFFMEVPQNTPHISSWNLQEGGTLDSWVSFRVHGCRGEYLRGPGPGIGVSI